MYIFVVCCDYHSYINISHKQCSPRHCSWAQSGDIRSGTTAGHRSFINQITFFFFFSSPPAFFFFTAGILYQNSTLYHMAGASFSCAELLVFFFSFFFHLLDANKHFLFASPSGWFVGWCWCDPKKLPLEELWSTNSALPMFSFALCSIKASHLYLCNVLAQFTSQQYIHGFNSTWGQGLFCVEFVCSSPVCMGSI